MANEIIAPVGTSGFTLYGVVRDAVGRPWRTTTSAFESYAGGNLTDYAVSLSEQGASGVYTGDMPAVPVGLYAVDVRVQSGATPEEADTIVATGSIEWSGTAAVPPPTAAAIADAVWDEVLSGHTTAGSAGKVLTDAGVSAAGGMTTETVLLTITTPSDAVTDADGTQLTALTVGQALTALVTALLGGRTGVDTREIVAAVPGVEGATITATRVSQTAIESAVVVPAAG